MLIPRRKSSVWYMLIPRTFFKKCRKKKTTHQVCHVFSVKKPLYHIRATYIEHNTFHHHHTYRDHNTYILHLFVVHIDSSQESEQK